MTHAKKSGGVLHLDPINHLTAQMVIILSNQLGKLNVNLLSTNLVSNLCAEDYDMVKCSQGNVYASSSIEQAQFLVNFNWVNNLYSNTYKTPFGETILIFHGLTNKGLEDHKVYLKQKKSPHLKICSYHIFKGMMQPLRIWKTHNFQVTTA